MREEEGGREGGAGREGREGGGEGGRRRRGEEEGEEVTPSLFSMKIGAEPLLEGGGGGGEGRRGEERRGELQGGRTSRANRCPEAARRTPGAG